MLHKIKEHWILISVLTAIAGFLVIGFASEAKADEGGFWALIGRGTKGGDTVYYRDMMGSNTETQDDPTPEPTVAIEALIEGKTWETLKPEDKTILIQHWRSSLAELFIERGVYPNQIGWSPYVYRLLIRFSELDEQKRQDTLAILDELDMPHDSVELRTGVTVPYKGNLRRGDPNLGDLHPLEDILTWDWILSTQRIDKNGHSIKNNQIQLYVSPGTNVENIYQIADQFDIPRNALSIIEQERARLLGPLIASPTPQPQATVTPFGTVIPEHVATITAIASAPCESPDCYMTQLKCFPVPAAGYGYTVEQGELYLRVQIKGNEYHTMGYVELKPYHTVMSCEDIQKIIEPLSRK